MKLLATVASILFCVLSFSIPARAVDYTFTTIVPDVLSEGGGINDANQAVGYYYPSGGQYGFSWVSGNLSDLGSNIAPWAISNTGQIVGLYHSGSVTVGFSYSSGNFTTFQVPGDSFTGFGGVNASGVIAGWYVEGNGAGAHGFTLNGGNLSVLDVPGAQFTQALGISNSGLIAGVFANGGYGRGFLYDGSVFSTIDVPGALATEAFGVNDAGVVSGTYLDVGGLNHGFVYDGHTYTTLDFPGAVQTAVYGINSFGSVAGTWDNGDPGSVGRRAFVAIAAVPEPETYAMLLAGIFSLIVVARRRPRGFADA